MVQCVAWARAIFNPDGGGPSIVGDWTNFGDPDSSGYPDLPAARGGLSYAGAHIPGSTLYLTASGTGDSSLFLRSQGPFRGTPPQGYFPGWPNSGNVPGTGWDMTTAQGSANANVAGLAQFPASPGLVQSLTGVRYGAYYIEYDIVGYDIFSGATGVGIGRLGVNLSEWIAGGGFNPSDSNGGAVLNGGNIVNGFRASIAANGGSFTDLADFNTVQGQSVGVAMLVSPDFVPAIFNWQQLQPVPLVCLPCSELLLPTNRFSNRFGT